MGLSKFGEALGEVESVTSRRCILASVTYTYIPRPFLLDKCLRMEVCVGRQILSSGRSAILLRLHDLQTREIATCDSV